MTPLEERVLTAVADEIGDGAPWAMIWDIAGSVDDVPMGELRQAVARLVEQGLMTACLCGCRMDAEVTTLGWRTLGREGPTPFWALRDVE